MEVTPEGRATSGLALAEAAEPQLRGPEQAAWLDRLERAHDELRSALAWSLDEADGAEVALRLAAALAWFWFVRSHLAEGRRWLERALGRGRTSPASLRAKALLGLGRLTLELGDLGSATAHFGEGLALARELEDRRAVAAALGGLGLLAHARGDCERAQALLRESLARFRDVGDELGVADAISNLGNVARDQEEIE